MKCPVKTNGADCHFSHGMYSHLATHIKKQHTKGDYTKFRLTPTVEAPFVCKGCDWAFTEGQIKNHFHEAKAVCTRNRKSKTEVESKEEQPLLVFDKPPVKPLIPANRSRRFGIQFSFIFIKFSCFCRNPQRVILSLFVRNFVQN